jgi:hypothetical protein
LTGGRSLDFGTLTMGLTSSQLDAIARQVYRRFPELRGQSPSVQRQTAEAKSGKPVGAGKERYVLTFKGSQQTPDGRRLNRIVRATADERGRVLKISTSK